MSKLVMSQKMTWREANGFFAAEEAMELQQLCSGKICLEIGSFYGKSTICIAEVASEVHAVDTWAVDGDGQTQMETINETIFQTFKTTTKGYHNIRPHIGRSSDRVPNFPDDYFDVVFIDATHQYKDVIEDVSLCFSKMKEDAIFIFHDYGTWPGVTQAVDDLFSMTSTPIVSVIYGKKENINRGILCRTI